MSTPKKRSANDGGRNGPSTPSSKGNDCPGAPCTPNSIKSANYNPFDVESLRKKKKLSKLTEEQSPEMEDAGLSVANLVAGDKHLDKPLNLRVTVICPFKQDKGDQINLKFYGMDSTGEIGVIFFQWDTKKYLDVLKVGAAISLTNFTVSEDGRNVTKVVKNRLGLKMMNSSKIMQFEGQLPLIPFRFEDINVIEFKEIHDLIDVLVVVDRNWGMQGSGETRRRDLTVVDKTGFRVLTLWKFAADLFGDEMGMCLAIRNVAIATYGGKLGLSSWNVTGIQVNPETEDAKDLLSWYKIKKDETMQALKDLGEDDSDEDENA